MNSTKLVAASVAAISVMGAITLAYAQSTGPAAAASTPSLQQPTSPPSRTMPMDSTRPDSRDGSGTTVPTTGNTTGGAASDRARDGMPTTGAAMPGDGRAMPNDRMSNDGATPDERAARADRN